MGRSDGEMAARTTSQNVLTGLRGQRQEKCWVNRKVLDGERGKGQGRLGMLILASPGGGQALLDQGPGGCPSGRAPLAQLQVTKLTGRPRPGLRWGRCGFGP